MSDTAKMPPELESSLMQLLESAVTVFSQEGLTLLVNLIDSAVTKHGTSTGTK